MNFNFSQIDENTLACLDSKTSSLKQSKGKSAKYAYDRNKSQKPRRNKSAFILFSGYARNQFESLSSLNANEKMMKLAELWKNLSDQEKEPFNQEAQKDKLRYQKEMEDFWKSNPAEALHNKTKRNHIKKPTSAYGLFLKDVTDSIKQEQPELKQAAIMKIISQRWKCLDEGSKGYYQEKARKEQEESRQMLEKYCAKNATHPKDLVKDTKQRRKNFLRKQVKLNNHESSPAINLDTPVESDSQDRSALTSVYPKNEEIPSFTEFDEIEYQPLTRPEYNYDYLEFKNGMFNGEVHQGASGAPTEADDSHLLFEIPDQTPLFSFGVNTLNFSFAETAAQNVDLYGNNVFQQFMSTIDFDNIYTGNGMF